MSPSGQDCGDTRSDEVDSDCTGSEEAGSGCMESDEAGSGCTDSDKGVAMSKANFLCLFLSCPEARVMEKYGDLADACSRTAADSGELPCGGTTVGQTMEVCQEEA